MELNMMFCAPPPIRIEYDSNASGGLPLDARMEPLNTPGASGVPSIRPEADREIPSGRAPDSKLKTGGGSPVATRSNAYAIPGAPGVMSEVVNWGGVDPDVSFSRKVTAIPAARAVARNPCTGGVAITGAVLAKPLTSVVTSVSRRPLANVAFDVAGSSKCMRM